MDKTEQATQIRLIGKQIIDGAIIVGHKYLQLCLYIRANRISPKLMAFELARLGFKSQRIAEINRVAQAPETLFTAFEAHYIGFHKCLALVVGDGRQGWRETEAARILLSGGILSAEELAGAVEDAEADSKAREQRGRCTLRTAARILCCKSTGPMDYDFPGCKFRVSVRAKKDGKPSSPALPSTGDSREET
jgi:hypothetical protein